MFQIKQPRRVLISHQGGELKIVIPPSREFKDVVSIVMMVVVMCFLGRELSVWFIDAVFVVVSLRLLYSGVRTALGEDEIMVRKGDFVIGGHCLGGHSRSNFGGRRSSES
jgi:hypothetical protein